jgi:hypothetical protein
MCLLTVLCLAQCRLLQRRTSRCKRRVHLYWTACFSAFDRRSILFACSKLPGVNAISFSFSLPHWWNAILMTLTYRWVKPDSPIFSLLYIYIFLILALFAADLYWCESSNIWGNDSQCWRLKSNSKSMRMNLVVKKVEWQIKSRAIWQTFLGAQICVKSLGNPCTICSQTVGGMVYCNSPGW